MSIQYAGSSRTWKCHCKAVFPQKYGLVKTVGKENFTVFIRGANKINDMSYVVIETQSTNDPP